jgi:hypothetical protein
MCFQGLGHQTDLAIYDIYRVAAINPEFYKYF